MWCVVACRACLATEGKFQKFNMVSTRMFTALTGLEIKEGDGFPTYLCGECYMQIKKATLFRKRSRRAHFVLKEIMTVKKQVTQKDIAIVDRKKTNLISPYSYWKPEQSIAYSITTSDVDTTKTDDNDQNGESVGDGRWRWSTDGMKPDGDTKITAEVYTSVAAGTNTKTTTTAMEIVKDWSVDGDVDSDVRPLQKIVKTYSSKVNSERVKLFNDIHNKIDYQIKTEKLGLDLNLKENSELFNTKGNLVKHKLETTQTSLIVVNIKPDNYKEIEEEERRQKEQEIAAQVDPENIVDDFQIDDDFDRQVDVIEEEIDLEDVFKGLKEIESESEEEPDMSWPEPNEQEKKDEKKKVAKKWKLSRKCRKAAHALTHCTSIRLMTTQEQIEAFHCRMLQEPFKSASFKCIICLCVKPDLPSLIEHVGVHTKKNQYTNRCPICKNNFKTEKVLTRHFAETHWYEYSCGKCEQKHYALKDLLACHETCRWSKIGAPRPPPRKEHPWTVTALPPALYPSTTLPTCRTWSSTPCPMCGQTFVNAANRDKHFVAKHTPPNRKKYYHCDICKIYIRHKPAIANHMEYCHLYSYKCDICGVKTLSRKQALEHSFMHPKPGVEFPCDSCDKTFNVAWKLQYHKSMVHCVDCNVCGHSNNSTDLYYVHQLRYHGYITLNTEAELNDPRFYCAHCNQYFMNEKVFYKHLARAGHDEARSYELGCITCKELFDSEEDLKRHKLDCKSTVFPNDCIYCNVTLKDIREYQSHYYKVHHDLPYPHIAQRILCEICGKTVYEKAKVRHFKAHNEESIIKCKFCSTVSLTPAVHVAHVLFNHTLRPYCCTICKMRFCYRCDCRDHILKCHAPVRPYKCEACNREFSHLDYLHDHCVKMHNVDLKKTDKSVFLGRKNIGLILVYPHMQIDGSIIEVDVLKRIEVYSCDYMEQNRKPISYEDCFFVDPAVDPRVPTKEPNMKYPRERNKDKQTKQKHIETKQKPIETKQKHIQTRQKHIETTQKTAKKKKKNTVEENVDEETQHIWIEGNKYERGVDLSEGLPTVEELLDRAEAIETEEMQIEETEDVLGELIEKDGEYYALVDGQLYKVEGNYGETS